MAEQTQATAVWQNEANFGLVLPIYGNTSWQNEPRSRVGTARNDHIQDAAFLINPYALLFADTTVRNGLTDLDIKLANLERYERRALSRRKLAMRLI